MNCKRGLSKKEKEKRKKGKKGCEAGPNRRGFEGFL